MTDQPTTYEVDDGAIYLVTDFDRLQGGMFGSFEEATAEATRIADKFPGNTIHVLRTCQTHRAGQPPRPVQAPAQGASSDAVVPKEVLTKAMRVFRSLPHTGPMRSEDELRQVLQAIWPVVPGAFRVRIDTMREAEKGESYTVTLYHPARPSDATAFESDGRMEIYHTYIKANAEHTLDEWKEFLALAASHPA